ncbi:barstar family protein [Janthinobacterium sp. LB3P118]|uniref:barstar family protein n=1 Tax=Janthinobacterium sp. LB3P118 TaxID=3424195 RepID=UPI003F1F5E25
MTIDLSDINTARQLHASLAAALAFPPMYGMNWDAFWDAITGLVAMPQQLELRGWQTFATRLPADAALLQRILARMAQEMPAQAAQVRYL